MPKRRSAHYLTENITLSTLFVGELHSRFEISSQYIKLGSRTLKGVCFSENRKRDGDAACAANKEHNTVLVTQAQWALLYTPH
jgi:hypothetical protein